MAAAAASIGGGRSAIFRTIWRSAQSASTRALSQSQRAPIRPDFAPRLAPSMHSSSATPRLLRRELSSLFPVHSAIASACLVSKLPGDVDASVECRFANYVSPI